VRLKIMEYHRGHKRQRGTFGLYQPFLLDTIADLSLGLTLGDMAFNNKENISQVSSCCMFTNCGAYFGPQEREMWDKWEMWDCDCCIFM